MSRPPRIEFENALYHVTSRGNGRQILFHTDEDRQRFLTQLQDNLESYGVVLSAWVLMTNHFHLVVKTPRGNLSRFMQRLNSSFSLYYRYKHGKPGHVLGGRYKARAIEEDEYLLAVTRYVHLNPVKTREMEQRAAAERVQYLEAYPWSSYPGYVNPKHWPAWMDDGVLREYGRNMEEARRRYRAYCHAAVRESDDAIREMMKANAYAIGSEKFVESIEQKLASRATGGPMDADVLLPWVGVPLDAIDGAVCRTYGVQDATLREHGKRAGLAKAVAVELAVRWSGKTLRAVGQHYGGISSQAVAMIRQRIRRTEGIDWTKLEQAFQSQCRSIK